MPGTLCAFHHLRGVHGGRITCRGEAPHSLVFELGLRPHQPPLLSYGSGDLQIRAPVTGSVSRRFYTPCI